MTEPTNAPPYNEVKAQLLRALYDHELQGSRSYVTYDELVALGWIEKDIPWIKRFADEQDTAGFIEVVRSFEPESRWGMRIMSQGQAYVEQQMEADPGWGGRKATMSTGTWGSSAFGTSTWGGGSVASGALVNEQAVNMPPTAAAGTAISSTSSLIENEAASPGQSEASAPPTADPSQWTGIQSRAARLAVVRDIIPIAQEAIDQLIADLSRPGDNGGPPLEEREEAVKALKDFHKALGEVLAAIDEKRFDDELGEGMVAELCRYGQRMVDSVRQDPMRYTLASVVFGTLYAAGLGPAAGFAAGAVLNVKKTG